jgi:hypothetical protein
VYGGYPPSREDLPTAIEKQRGTILGQDLEILCAQT